MMGLYGIGPSGAARLLVEVGDITRFPDKNHFGSWTGTAPIDASSGDNVRHRLSRGGNRQINRVLHITARRPTRQLRHPTEGPSLLRPDQGPRQDLQRVDAAAETTSVRHRLPDHGQRRRPPDGDRPGRATR